jgi:antitoxin component YwqK of YwqJK toxin-antitoxin module
MKKLLFIFLLAPLCCFAQKYPDLGLDKVKIVNENEVIQTETIPVTSTAKLNPELFYYWYHANAIHATQGSFSGKLLNGTFSAFYLNKNLKQQGTFKKGLKDGDWKDWTDEGNLTSIIQWKNGTKNGAFILFDSNGKVIEAGKYKENSLNGRIKFYHGQDSVQVVRYNNGKITLAKTHPDIWDKINIFKKIKLHKTKNNKVSQPNNSAVNH